MKKRKSQWEQLKIYVNKMPIGNCFTRKQMIDDLTHDSEDCWVQCRFGSSLDSYKKFLMHLGCLEPVKRGMYRKIKDVDVRITSSIAHAFIYDKSWKKWFIPPEERLEMLLTKKRV